MFAIFAYTLISTCIIAFAVCTVVAVLLSMASSRISDGIDE